MPDFSIVIPSCCRPDLLRRCLASVQTHAPRGTEVVVVDDGSPGQAASHVAAEFCTRIVRRQRASGFCAAATAGVRAARGTVVEVLNDDTEVTARWADAALAHFDDASVGAVAPLVLFPACAGQQTPCVDSAGDAYDAGGFAWKIGHGRRLTPDLLRPRAVFGASASSAFYRRELLLRAGAFPIEFGAYFEDVDLSFRLHRAGYRIVFEPESHVYHLGSATHGRPGRRLLEQQSRNEERVFWRNLPPALLARSFPRHLAVLLAKACRRWERGGLAPFVFGRLRLLGEIGEVARHRRWLRSTFPAPAPADWMLDWPRTSEGSPGRGISTAARMPGQRVASLLALPEQRPARRAAA